MYNRYVPQSDGSFRRSHIPDPPTPPRKDSPKQVMHTPDPCEPTIQGPVTPPVSRSRSNHPRAKQAPSRCDNCPERKSDGITGFLKSLIPADFDTGDLLVVLLLLLMAGDCKEDQNSALLTLVLYLFL